LKFRSLLCTLLLAAAPAFAKPEPIVPVPPDYVLDKQLEGEDPLDIAKPVFSQDNSFVAAFMASPHLLNVWETKTGKIVASIAEDVHGMDAADGLEFTPDGKQLILMRSDKPLKFIDWKAGKVVREVPINVDPKKLLAYAFSPTQDLLAASGMSNKSGIALWDMKAGKKLKDFLPGKTVSGLDMLITRDRQGKPVRLLSYGRGVDAGETDWKDVAGLINIDSGTVTPLLNDIPADKKKAGSLTYFMTDFEWGGGHLLVSYNLFPPTAKAGVYLIDTWTGKYLSQQDLGNYIIKFRPKYLWKPFYGFVVPTMDMRSSPYASSADFLVPDKSGLKVLDSVHESKIPIYGLRVSDKWDWAAVVTRSQASDACKMSLYKLVPKK
jgi:hypothetical protein